MYFPIVFNWKIQKTLLSLQKSRTVIHVGIYNEFVSQEAMEKRARHLSTSAYKVKLSLAS